MSRAFAVSLSGYNQWRELSGTKEAGIFVPRTTDSRHGGPLAANRPLEAEPPKRVNQVWRSDITYVPTREGWFCVAAVLDDYSRRILG